MAEKPMKAARGKVTGGTLYRLKPGAPVHYISGDLKTADSAPFPLPNGVTPGKWLERIEQEPQRGRPRLGGE